MDSHRIAIIGMALRFPGADSPEAFWADIRTGTPRIHRFSRDELAAAGVPEHDAPDLAAASGLIDGVDLFDASFFGMSAREAVLTDPQQRLFLEVCQHALEDGGYAGGGRVGVYAGTGYRLHSLHSYLRNNLSELERGWSADKQAQVGNYEDYTATRVAFRLGLTGPAVNVATACSSSLVAVHLACQALLAGDADLALAGATALHLPQVTGHRYVKGSTMSRTGVLRAFDAGADGTVAGNGVAAVLLKRLDRAIADGDTVHAVVLGSGVTNDGDTKPGFAAPSAIGQRDAVLRALAVAGVPAESIGYLEAHGTGTFKGDPIEFTALTEAYRAHTARTGFCALGTVKPRIGHLDSCAGMAGLIGATLALRHGVIPPLVNFATPNPALPLAESPFTIPTEARPWPGPRRAGVHSVGMGGTNAHVILEQAPDPRPRDRRWRTTGLLPLSAKDPGALTDLAVAVRDHLRRHPDTDPADVLATLGPGRRHFAHRLAVTGRTAREQADALDAHLAGHPEPATELAAHYVSGGTPDWAELLRDCDGRRIPLPLYPFRRTRHWTGPPPRPMETTMPDATTLTQVVRLTSRYLGYQPEEVDPDRAFVDLGADSLQLISMLTELEGAFGVEVSMRELLESAGTPRLIAAVIQQRQGGGAVAPAPQVTEPVPAATAPVAAPPAPALAEVQPVPVAPAAPAPVPVAVPAPATPPVAPAARPVEPEPVAPAVPAVVGPRVTVSADSGMAAAATTDTQRAHTADLIRRLAERTRTSKDLAQRHRHVLADSRAVVGFRHATKELRYPLASREARGARLTDVDGNTYVDITMGFGALLFGHEPEFVTEAVREHLARGLRLGPRSADTGEVAALLAELTGMERVAFASSGTEANSAAIRLARAHTGRDRVVMFRGSYHGHIDSVLGRPGGGLRTVPVSPGIPHSAVSELLVLEYGDPASLETIREHADSIAAVLVEPVQCRNPSLRPAEFVRGLRELTRERGIVLVFDEMLTGLRPHPGGAQHHYGVTADLATYGKALGAGYPIGAIAGRAEIMDGVDGGFWQYGDDSSPQRETVFFGGTYMQHPVSMAAAKAVLTHLKAHGPALQEAVNARTARLARELNTFFAAEEFPLRLDHFGSMFRFTHRADMELLYHHLLLRGVHVWEWRSFYLSTAHTDADVDLIAEAVRDSLRELRRAGYFPRTRPAPDFSVYFFGDAADTTQRGRYDLVVDTVRYADEHDFHAVWLPERHFHSFGGLSPNPVVLAAALTGHTKRIRLNAGSVVLPLHDPIRVAEEWSVVDNLSGGRVGLGFGTGWHADDFVLHPSRYERRRDLAFEALDELKRLWRGDSVRRVNGAGTEVEVRVHPRPVQELPPMWLATTGRAESYEQAGRLGLGVVTNLMTQTVDQLAGNIACYRRARAEAGLDPATGRVTVLLHTYLADDHATARAEALEPMVGYLRSSLLMRSAATASGRSAEDLASASPEDLDALFRHAYDRYCDQRALVGSPETCEAVVRRLHAAGADEIAALVDFGMTPEQVASGMSRLNRLRLRLHGTEAAPVAPAVPAERTAPASPAQRRLWLACQLTGTSAYNEIQAVRLHGPLDEAALGTAVRALVARHPGLRTTFRAAEELRQVVTDTTIDLQVTDHSGRAPEDAIADVIRQESRRAYDLATGPLFTPRLLRLGPDDHALVLGLHHLVTDGHSATLIAKDLHELYRAAVTGDAPVFPAEATSTVDLPPAEPDPAALEWWRTHLGPQPPVLRPPTDRPRAGAPRGMGESVHTWLSADRTAALRRWSGNQGATLFATLLTAWRIVLRRFSGQDEFVLGTTSGHRPPGAEHAVGYFVSLLPLRARVTDDLELREAVRTARDVVFAATEHSRVDQDVLLAEVNPDPGTARPLTPVSIDLDTEALPATGLPGLRAEPVADGAMSAPLELALMVVRSGSGLRLRIRYDSALYDESTVRRYLAQLDLVLAAMAEGHATRVGELPVLTAADEKQLRAFGTGEQPGAPARLELTYPATVVEGDQAHDSAELRSAAGSVTARLRELGVRRGDVVAVALPRGFDFAAAVLGTVAAGAAYLPLDLAQPRPRLAAMLADAAPVALVGAADLDPSLGVGLPRVRVGRGEPVTAEPVAAEDLLCLLYTSGSTGRPKGVALEHGNLAAVVAVYLDRLGITDTDRLSWYSSTGFDASNIELWPALSTGAQLHVVPDQVRLEPADLVAWLCARRITVAFLPTPIAEAVLAQPWPADTALRVLCTGGERLNSRPREDIPFTVYNIYGPTETSVFCAWGPVAPDLPGQPSLGTPNPGMVLEVRDPAGRPVPPGAAGELHVGGPQVARGYHGRADDRFSVAGCRWYRTGDLVRWRNDGTLDFLGRADDQVQIRGVRVEPAEVAAAVRALPGVREATVLASTDPATGHGVLTCQVTAESTADEQGQVRRWRAGLAEVLPSPMVPRHWHVVSALPLTVNGKHDRAADPVREEWAAVLGTDEFGDTDRFFDLGGHSVSAMTLLNRVRERYGVDYPITAFFADPTPRGMRERLGRVRGEL